MFCPGEMREVNITPINASNRLVCKLLGSRTAHSCLRDGKVWAKINVRVSQDWVKVRLNLKLMLSLMVSQDWVKVRVNVKLMLSLRVSQD